MIGMAMLDLHPRVAATTILERRELADGVVLLTLHAPELANATQPGQYLMVIPPSGEAAATALAVYEAEGKRASILFFVTGKRTRELATLACGDRLDVVGALGYVRTKRPDHKYYYTMSQMLADIIVYPKDLNEIQLEDILKIPVVMTIAGGKIVYQQAQP